MVICDCFYWLLDYRVTRPSPEASTSVGSSVDNLVLPGQFGIGFGTVLPASNLSLKSHQQMSLWCEGVLDRPQPTLLALCEANKNTYHQHPLFHSHFKGTADPNIPQSKISFDNIEVAHLAVHALSVSQAWIGPLSLINWNADKQVQVPYKYLRPLVKFPYLKPLHME
jgi:hypothetical protein